jgi:hypothetical protein
MRTATTRTPRHKWTKGNDGKYHCPVCDAEFDRPAGLGRHFASMHPGEPTNGMAPPRPPLEPLPQSRADLDRPILPPDPDRGTGPLAVLPPLSPDSGKVRRVCDVAVAILMMPEWQRLSLDEQRDVLAVVRSRALRTAAVVESMLTGDTATTTLQA